MSTHGAEQGKWYYTDPDNRKDQPATHHCARCMKPIMATGFVRIVKHYDEPWFRLATLKERENALMGLDCLKYVVKQFGEVK